MDVANHTVRVDVAAVTDPGLKRADNQDNMMVANLSEAAAGGAWPEGPPVTIARSFELGNDGAVFMVADGMGGAAGGATASRMAVQGVHDEMRARSANGTLTPAAYAMQLKQAIENASANIYATAARDPAFFGMGTTATLAGVLYDHVYLAQVGDSRGYLVRNGVAVQVTRDQSVVQELVDAGTMTEEEAETSVHSNKILQAMGAMPNVRAVMTFNQLRRGDVIVLCSDGLTRVVRKHEIAQAAATANVAQDICKQLIDLANSRGGPDNVTVVAARFDGAGLQAATEADVVERIGLDLSESE